MKHVTLSFTLSVLLGVVCCTSGTSPERANEDDAPRHCTEPQDPYDEGSGHYAEYEWAETNNPGTCGGRSQSFTEGCEEYQHQESEYEDCEAQKKK
jgi:hypothetical protein